MLGALKAQGYGAGAPRRINRLKLALAAAFMAAALLGASSSARATDCPVQPLPGPELLQTFNLDLLKRQALNYKCFGEYDRDIAKVIAEAKAYVERRAGEVKNPALVLDIDETSVSNWVEISTNDFGFILEGDCSLKPRFPCGSNDWELHHDAEAIVPTRELFNLAKSKGVAVFFVTARPESHRAATIRNLNNVGYDGWKELFLRPDDFHGPVREFKTAQRAGIEAQGYTIIANVGDQMSDLEGGYAERTFKIPNPFYFIP
jgi:HAD superfamily, subfamily IIIB (Acid phosphatase)